MAVAGTPVQLAPRRLGHPRRFQVLLVIRYGAQRDMGAGFPVAPDTDVGGRTRETRGMRRGAFGGLVSMRAAP